MLASALLVATFAFTRGGDAARTVKIRSESRTTASLRCDKYASPSGSNSASGRLRHPLATVAALDRALRPGQTGCLKAGHFGSLSAIAVLTKSGTSRSRITITSVPGQTATVTGLIELQGSNTTLSRLNIDGSNTAYNAPRSGTQCPYPVSNGLEINGHNDIFEHNNLYQSVAKLRGNGLGIGWNGQADGTIIRFNRIHDLGRCEDYDQMIYVAHGNGVQIYNNWLWNDPHGWGIQIYPRAGHAHIYNNVIDGAGSGFVLGGSPQVSDNVIEHNVVMNSTGLPSAGLGQGVGISTSDPVGTGNAFANNVVFHNPGGIGNGSGILLSNNVTSAPRLVNPRAHDYRTATH